MTSLIILFVTCFITITTARPEADIKKWFIQQAIDCTKEHPLSAEELQMIKEHKIPDNKNAKCLVACMFRKFEWVDSKGMFNGDNAFKLSEKEYPNDQTKLDNAKKLFDLCMKVNDEVIENDTDGCERSTRLAMCLVDNSPKMGFFLN